ncbi:glycosyltransferase family 2 protein [Gaoshiqia sediminis]|uniref:Glycosyltransferase family 2 protein n=1 Tax=Gaoshiqia sediminis TaxID=2986998 RepID=A0AA41YA18_9BACT|nr:glycosyltransferase family A protein [Gaoshiqia sediminis]MCW0484740.1 glycosyltransferase family 2 protein [Gaoshiqia sediminis]
MFYPKLSIIIPCFNNGSLLAVLIECIRRQTFEDWELIVVDDQSTDATPSIVRGFEQTDKRIKLIVRSQEPKGSATCRNIGFDMATGKYIIHFDADDLISDTCFENRVKFMDNHPTIDYASFPAMAFTDPDKLPSFHDKGRLYGADQDDIDLLKRFLSADYPFSTWNNIYKRTALEDIRWDEKVKIYTDFSYIVPGILKGLKHQFSGQEEIDYYYRVNPPTGSMCSTFVSPEKCSSTIYLFSKTLDSLSKRADYKKRKKQFLQFIVLHFERLVMDGDKTKVQDYLVFCEKYFRGNIATSLDLISKIVIGIQNLKLRKGVLYLLIVLRFGYLKYFKVLLKQLK